MTTQAITPLRQRMIEDMNSRKLCAHTQWSRIYNLRAHKVPGMREAIEKAGATVRYLPQYSPDLNPIKMPYRKFKTFLRKVAARTVFVKLPHAG